MKSLYETILSSTNTGADGKTIIFTKECFRKTGNAYLRKHFDIDKMKQDLGITEKITDANVFVKILIHKGKIFYTKFNPLAAVLYKNYNDAILTTTTFFKDILKEYIILDDEFRIFFWGNTCNFAYEKSTEREIFTLNKSKFKKVNNIPEDVKFIREHIKKCECR